MAYLGFRSSIIYAVFKSTITLLLLLGSGYSFCETAVGRPLETAKGKSKLNEWHGSWHSDSILNIKITQPHIPDEALPIDSAGIDTSLAEEVKWLQKTVLPLKTVEPDSNVDDLMPLKNGLSDARIAGLGEATHGTSEFAKIKHRLIKFLVQNMHFNLVVFEEGMVEMGDVNKYVNAGFGDPKEAFSLWPLRSQEVLHLLDWIKEYNKTATIKVQIAGCDMQTPDRAIDDIHKFVVQNESTFLPSLDSEQRYITPMTQMQRDENQELRADDTANIRKGINAADRIYAKLKGLYGSHQHAYRDSEFVWVIQEAKLVCQSLELVRERFLYPTRLIRRDEFMADNIKWLTEHSLQPTKAIVWAHNWHIEKTYPRMGFRLASAFHEQYVAFGFLFNSGNYIAVGDTGIGSYPARESFGGSCEYHFHQAGIQLGILDLSKASENSASQWLLGLMPMREIGAAVEDGFRIGSITHDFDQLIYVDKTTPISLY